MAWNENAIKTECTIIEHKFVDTPCPDTGGGGGGGGGDKKKRYDDNGCYDGSIFVRYLLTYTKSFKVTGGIYTAVASYLNDNYPVNKIIPCWYQKNDVNDMELDLRNTTGILAFAIVVISLDCIGLLIWFCIEWFCCRRYEMDSYQMV